ncbi:MAG: aldolase/citrate lyase family protein [Clostridiales bacterium]|nr:aldolase/citrate lyase family protein [Clostridiales bacterium]
MKNRVKEKITSNQPVVGTFFEMGGLSAVECLGISGLDFLIIDTEHGPFETESMMGFIRVAELKGITPFVRIKEISRAAVLKALDVGAQGLIIPCVDTVEEVKSLIEYGKYTPVGSRGFILGRPAEYGFSELAKDFGRYFEHCNAESMLIPQCETVGCLESIEEIAAIDGVDGIFIGPYDLSIGLGKPAQFDAPEFISAVDRVIKACRSAGKPCFAYSANPAGAKDYLNKGCMGVAVNTDAAIYIDAFKKLKSDVLTRG